MADYSGYVHSTHDMLFWPEKNPNFFWSGKVFTESCTRVPKEYLGFLLDMYADAVKRGTIVFQSDQRPRITFENGKWVLHGYALSWNKDKVLEYFGWDNACEHARRQKAGHRDYDVCLTCWEIFCEHKEQNLQKTNGVVDPRWACNECGALIE